MGNKGNSKYFGLNKNETMDPLSSSIHKNCKVPFTS